MRGSQLPSDELWEDLCTRFILNVPNHETDTFDRLLFVIEQAHWYYEDVLVDNDPNLKSLSLREFVALTFQKCPGLEQYQNITNDVYKEWLQYKQAVPVNGAIMLDPTLEKCLLVKGWNKSAGWGFPRGKIMKNEVDVDCAVREVKEETGFDVAKLIVEDQFIEVTLGAQRCRLFVIPGVPETTVFAPLARKEISALAWHRITDLPSTKDEANQVYLTEEGDRHRFFMVWPYVKKLRRWIKQHRKALARQPRDETNGMNGHYGTHARTQRHEAAGDQNVLVPAENNKQSSAACHSSKAHPNGALPLQTNGKAVQPGMTGAHPSNGRLNGKITGHAEQSDPKSNGINGMVNGVVNGAPQQGNKPVLLSRQAVTTNGNANGQRQLLAPADVLVPGGSPSLDVPGKSLLTFKFDRRAIMQRLKFDA